MKKQILPLLLLFAFGSAANVLVAQQPGIWAAGLQGSNSAPLGFKVMYLNRIGYYAGFRMGSFPPDYTYSTTGTGLSGISESSVYKIDNERLLASYAITAGIILHLSRNIYLCAGLGYGLEQLFWNYQAYDTVQKQTHSGWALHESFDRKGVVVETQAIVRRGRLLLSLGIATIQNKTFQQTGGVGFQITGGIGYCFSKTN